MSTFKTLFWGLCLCTASLVANENEISPALNCQNEIASCYYPYQECMLPSNYYSGPPPPCFPCKPCYSYFYVGGEGGWLQRLRHVPNRLGVGFNNLGTAFDAKVYPGYTVSANIGYRWNCLWRTDFSYTYFHPKSLQGKTRFPINVVESFKAHLHSHIALFNTYVHLVGLCELFPCFDPYITCGVGVALNRFDHIQEFNTAGIHYANIQPYTQSQFAGRLGVGVMKYFCRSWILDLGFNANYIRSIRSGNERETFNIPGVSVASHEKIGIYRFKNLWIGNFYLGLKYAF